MKNKIQYSLFIALVIMFSSCVREEQRLFPESAALRMNHAVDKAKSLLIDQSNVNGWVMEYFPTNDTEGYTLLMSFKSNTFVTIAGRNQYLPTFATDSSAYEVIGDMGPVLTFDTYNKVFHLFSNPIDPSGGNPGNGLLGDYEFIIMNISSDNVITLQGKKRGTAILMHPLAQGQDWKGYFDLLDGMNATIFNSKIPMTLTLKGGNEADSIFYLSNGVSHIFTSQTQDAIDAKSSGTNIPFIITDYGLRFAQPFPMGGDSVQSFKLSDDKNELVCVDEGKNAKITALNPADLFSSLINNKRAMVFINSDANMSASAINAYTAVDNGVAAYSRKLSYVQFVNDKNGSFSLDISTVRTGSANIDGFLSFTMTKKNDSDIDLAFNGFSGSYDANGKAYYDNYGGVSDFVAFVEGSYTIDLQGSALSSGLVRFTGKSDPNKWFDLQAK